MVNSFLQSSSTTATSWMNISHVMMMCLATFKFVEWINSTMLSFVLMLGFSYWLGFVLYRWLMSNVFTHSVASYRKAVLLTSADTEYGMLLVKRLASRGFQVLAGCRDPKSDIAAKLATLKNVSVHGLDVKDEESCRSAFMTSADALSETGNDLWCIVCNTEMSDLAELEWHNMKSVTEMLDINLLGTLRIVKTFLPLLRETKGRIILTGSVSSSIAVPGMVIYSMGKAALASLAEGLSRELRIWDIDVCTVQTSLYVNHNGKYYPVDYPQLTLRRRIGTDKRDAIVASSYDHSTQEKQFMQTEMYNLPENIRKDYGVEYFESFWRTYARFIHQHATVNVHQLVDTFERAITTVWPQTHLRVGHWHQLLLQNILSILPIEVTDAVLEQTLANSTVPNAILKREVFAK